MLDFETCGRVVLSFPLNIQLMKHSREISEVRHDYEVIGNSGWLPYCGSVSFVRRRCWQPCFYRDADDATAAAALERAPISLIQKKAPSTAKETIFEQVLGDISLELLGQSLECDDWRDPTSLMAFYWEESAAHAV